VVSPMMKPEPPAEPPSRMPKQYWPADVASGLP
jgi:hypothetical protein